MNVARFTKRRFEELGLDTVGARRRANELQAAVARALHADIAKAFKRVIDKLNAKGHSLRPYGRQKVGDISYRELREGGATGLRLGCDVVISAGYAHVVSPQDAARMSERGWNKLTGWDQQNPRPSERKTRMRRKRVGRARRRPTRRCS